MGQPCASSAKTQKNARKTQMKEAHLFQRKSALISKRRHEKMTLFAINVIGAHKTVNHCVRRASNMVTCHTAQHTAEKAATCPKKIHASARIRGQGLRSDQRGQKMWKHECIRSDDRALLECINERRTLTCYSTSKASAGHIATEDPSLGVWAGI